MLREVGARLDVVVTGGDRVVVATFGEPCGDRVRDFGAAVHRERAAFAEVVLDVHDDDRPAHAGNTSPRIHASGQRDPARAWLRVDGMVRVQAAGSRVTL